MTPQQIALVQSSWSKVLPIQDRAAMLFYDKLFEMDPSLRSLFKGDMAAQGRKLMAMINAAVSGLTRLEEIVPVVQDLGKRHLAYGVQNAHYDTVGTALLWTLEKELGPEFTAEVKQAWAADGLLAAVMKEDAATVTA